MQIFGSVVRIYFVQFTYYLPFHADRALAIDVGIILINTREIWVDDEKEEDVYQA
jgi:hypothetical protein